MDDTNNLDSESPALLGRVTAILAAAGTAWILGIMALICADVIGRAVFNAPILGVPELVQFSIVGIVFLQLPQTLRTGGLTRSDVLLGGIQRKNPRLAHAMEFVFTAVGIALCLVIVKTTWPLMIQAFANREFYGAIGTIQVPTGPLKCIIMLGCSLMALHLMFVAWSNLRAALRPSPAAP